MLILLVGSLYTTNPDLFGDAMATNLDFVSLQVRSLENSSRFYTSVLGFETGPSPNVHAVVFKTRSGAIFAVRTPLIDLESVPAPGAGTSLWFSVPDADKVYRQAEAAGATIVSPITDGPFGRVFVLSDPDNYLITIHQGE